MSSSYDRQSAAAELAHLASELARVRDRYGVAHTMALSLTRITDWKARAAVAFHERAEGWARDVAHLGELAEDVCAAAARARDRAAFDSLNRPSA